MPVLIDIVRKLRKAAGPDVAIFGWVSAPFRSACMLRGLTDLFMDMYDDPDFVSDLVDYCVARASSLPLALAEAGADVIEIGNASPSSAMISAEAYARFVHPSNKAIISSLKKAGITTMMHICGDLNDRADLACHGGDGHSLLRTMDVPRFKAKYGCDDLLPRLRRLFIDAERHGGRGLPRVSRMHPGRRTRGRLHPERRLRRAARHANPERSSDGAGSRPVRAVPLGVRSRYRSGSGWRRSS